MLQLNPKNDKYSVFVMILFFIVMLIMYGRGISYDAEAVEKNLIIVGKESSKAPFLIITSFILLLINKNKIDFKIIANLKLWIGYFLALFILSFLRNNIINDFSNFGTIIFSFLLFFGLIRFLYRIKFSILEKWFLVISLIILCLCVVFHLYQGHQILFFPDRSVSNFERLGGMFYYAHTAAIAGITLLFSLKKYLECKKIKYLISLLFCLTLLIATDTRSALVATIFSSFFLLFKHIKFYKIFLFCISIYFLSISYTSILGTNNAISTSNDDTDFRVKIWVYSLNKASQRLLTGYGNEVNNLFENFALADNLHDPHNSIISLLLQSGLIGVIIYFIIYFKNCIKCNKSANNDYRFLYFFWIFFSFFWGNVINNLSSFISMYMMITLYAFTLYPSGEIKKSSIKLQLKKVN